MPANDYFRVLELDAERVLALPDDRAAAEVEQAYDRLMNAGHALGAENPRADLYEKAKTKLCDPEARRDHAETLGYTATEAAPPPPRAAPPPPKPEPRHRKPPEPRHRRSASRGAGPWWMGGLLAMPAAVLYIAVSGLTFERTAQAAALAAAGIAVAVLTAYFVGVRWLKILLIGPFFIGFISWLAQLTIGGFIRDMSSWNVPPEIGILAVLGALGLGLGLTGQVRPTIEFTGEYLGTTTVRFFTIALVLIPATSLIMPTRGASRGTGTATEPVERGPTAQTEGELNLTRGAWRDIQGGLRALGHYSGTVDGLSGPMTRAAITAWQRTQRGIATGFLNQTHADTLAALAPTPPPAPPPPGRPEPVPAPAPAAATTASLVVTVRRPGRALATRSTTCDTPSATSILLVTEGVSQVVDLVARALPGRLTVTTNATAAIVAIDGGEARAAPVEDIEVESGARLVTVSAPGYNTHEQYVDIAADASTTHHATLEEASLDAEMAQLQQMFDRRRYRAAADMAGNLTRMLVTWGELGIDVRENLALTLAIQGQALYAVGNFAESVQPLYNAVRFGQQIELPIKHRHGGGGFRQGFCTGTFVYSSDQIAFRSIDDPDHGFAVQPEDISSIERAEAQEGFLSRLNTEVEGRGSMDFVHPNSEQQRRDPDSALITDIVCRDCNQALAVHEQMLSFLTRNTQ